MTPEELEEIEDWHWMTVDFGKQLCEFCSEDWPCPMNRLIEHIRGQEQQLAALRAVLQHIADVGYEAETRDE